MPTHGQASCRRPACNISLQQRLTQHAPAGTVRRYRRPVRVCSTDIAVANQEVLNLQQASDSNHDASQQGNSHSGQHGTNPTQPPGAGTRFAELRNPADPHSAVPIGTRLRNARTARHLATMILDSSPQFTKIDLTIACSCLSKAMTSLTSPTQPRRLLPSLILPNTLLIDALHAIFSATATLLPILASEEIMPVLQLSKLASTILPSNASISLTDLFIALEPCLPSIQPDTVALILWYAADSKAKLPPTLLDTALERLPPDQLKNLRPTRIAAILWSLSALGYKPNPEWLQGYLEAAVQHIQAFSPDNLQALLWGISSARPEVTPQQSDALVAQLVSHLDKCDPMVVCLCIRSFAKLSTPISPLAQAALLDFLQTHMAAIPPSWLAKTTWNLANLGFRPSIPWLKSFYQTSFSIFKVNRDTRRRRPATRSSALLSTDEDSHPLSPTADPNPSPARGRETQSPRRGRSPSPSPQQQKSFNLHDISNLLSSLRMWNLRPPVKWLSRLYAHTIPLLPTSTPLNTAIILAEAVRLQPLPPASFLTTAAAILTSPSHAADGRLLNKSLVNLSRFTNFTLPPAKQRFLFLNTAPHLHTWNPQDLLHILTSFARLSLQPPPFWRDAAASHIAHNLTPDPAISPQTLLLLTVQLARILPTPFPLATPGTSPPTAAARAMFLAFDPTASNPPRDPHPDQLPDLPESTLDTPPESDFDLAMDDPYDAALDAYLASAMTLSQTLNTPPGSPPAAPPAPGTGALIATFDRITSEITELNPQEAGLLLTAACKLQVQLPWPLIDLVCRDMLRTEFHFHLMILQQLCGMPEAPPLRRFKVFFRDAVRERLMWPVFGLEWKAKVVEAVVRWSWQPDAVFVQDVVGSTVVDLVVSEREEAEAFRRVAEAAGVSVGPEWKEAFAVAFGDDEGLLRGERIQML